MEHLAQMISTYAEECSTLKQPASEPVPPRPTEKWKQTPAGFVKADVMEPSGVMISREDGGFVLRGDDGMVVSSGYGKLMKVLDPFHAEVIACLQAVQRVVELRIQHLVLATDAAMMIQAVNAQEIDHSFASGLVWELKDLLACNFVSKKVLFNHHSCNSVAHALAAIGVGLSPELYSIRDSISVCIQVLVANDLAAAAE